MTEAEKRPVEVKKDTCGWAEEQVRIMGQGGWARYNHIDTKWRGLKPILQMPTRKLNGGKNQGSFSISWLFTVTGQHEQVPLPYTDFMKCGEFPSKGWSISRLWEASILVSQRLYQQTFPPAAFVISYLSNNSHCHKCPSVDEYITIYGMLGVEATCNPSDLEVEAGGLWV